VFLSVWIVLILTKTRSCPLGKMRKQEVRHTTRLYQPLCYSDLLSDYGENPRLV